MGLREDGTQFEMQDIHPVVEKAWPSAACTGVYVGVHPTLVGRSPKQEQLHVNSISQNEADVKSHIDGPQGWARLGGAFIAM